jgi:hypothetical protein
MPILETAKDLAWQVAAIGYAVEVFKDVFQRASTGTVRAFMYGVAFLIAALASWRPDLPYQEFVLTVLMMGTTAATAAWAAHAGVKAAVPTLPSVAAAEAKVKAAPALRSRADLEAEGRAKEETARVQGELAAEDARVTEIVRRVLADARQPVTPLRVPAPPVVTDPVAEPPVLTRVPRERDLT